MKIILNKWNLQEEQNWRDLALYLLITTDPNDNKHTNNIDLLTQELAEDSELPILHQTQSTHYKIMNQQAH